MVSGPINPDLFDVLSIYLIINGTLHIFEE